MTEETCFSYTGMVSQYLECKNLHPEDVINVGYSGECKRCEYVVLLPDELLEGQ